MFELNAMILAMGICFGGLAQVIAGIMEFKNKNTFGATAFTAYGFFWLSLVLIWWNPFSSIPAADPASMGWYLLMGGIFTSFLFLSSLRHNRITQTVFGSLTLLFVLLALGNFVQSPVIHVIAGVVGVFCGGSTCYSALSQSQHA